MEGGAQGTCLRCCASCASLDGHEQVCWLGHASCNRARRAHHAAPRSPGTTMRPPPPSPPPGPPPQVPPADHPCVRLRSALPPPHSRAAAGCAGQGGLQGSGVAGSAVHRVAATLPPTIAASCLLPFSPLACRRHQPHLPVPSVRRQRSQQTAPTCNTWPRSSCPRQQDRRADTISPPIHPPSFLA